jgi:O-antigen/teichoic acid export membrane protein
MGIVVARLLGPADTGAFNVVLVSLQLLLTASTLGLQAGVTYFVSSGRWQAADAFRQVQLAALFLGLVGVAIGACLVVFAAGDLFTGIDPWLVVAAFAALPFALSWLFTAHVALGADEYEAFAGAAPLQNMAALVLVAVLTPLFGLTGAIVGLAVSHPVNAARLVVWGLRRLGRRSADWLSKMRARLLAAGRFGLTTWVPMALQFVNNRFDLLLLSFFASNSTVGRYAIALAVGEIGLLLPRALTSIVFPRVAALESSARSDEQTMVTEKSVRHALLLMPGTAVLLVVALFAIPLVYGDDFSEATGMGLVLVPGVLALGLANVLGATITGKGRPRYLLYGTLFVTPPTLLLYGLLIPPFEAYGAAAASALSYTALAIANFFYFRRVTSSHGVRRLLPGRDELGDYRALWRGAKARFASRR